MRHLVTGIAALCAMAVVSHAQMQSVTFEPSEGYTVGPIVGQQGWSVQTGSSGGSFEIVDDVVSPMGGSTQALRAKGVTELTRIVRDLDESISSGLWRVGFDFRYTGQMDGSTANLISTLTFYDLVTNGTQQIFQPYIQDGDTGGPGGAGLNGFTCTTPFGGYGGTNLVSGFTFTPHQWYRVEFLMDFDRAQIMDFRIYDISSGSKVLVTSQTATRFYFNHDGVSTFYTNMGRWGFRHDPAGPEDAAYIDNFSIAPDTLVAPELKPVLPNPETFYTGFYGNKVYSRYLTLVDPSVYPDWAVLAGPPGTTVSGVGVVGGWTPQVTDTGPFTIEVEAFNGSGADSKTWQVYVAQYGNLVDLPMDQQVDIGMGNAIYGEGDAQNFISFHPADPDNGEPEGWARLNIKVSGWYYGPSVDFVKAIGRPIDISECQTTLSVDLRYFQGGGNTNPYGDAPIFLRLMTYNEQNSALVGYRDYSIIYATQRGDPPYPTWTTKEVKLNDLTFQDYTESGSFDPTKVHRLRFYGTDWAGKGDDFVDVKNLVISNYTEAPVLKEVSSPQNAYPDVPYTCHLSMDSCQPVNWSLSGPSGSSIDADGVVRWTPTEELLGQTFEFTATASNPTGSDSKTWLVKVREVPVPESGVAAPWGTLHANIFATQSSADPSMTFSEGWSRGVEKAWILDLNSAGLTGGTERGGISFDEQGNLYFKTTEGYLVSVSPSGSIRWTGHLDGTRLDLGIGDATTPVVGDGGTAGRVYVLTDRGVAAFNKADGNLVWEQTLPGANFDDPTQGPNRLTPVLYDGILYVIGIGSPQKTVFGIDATVGSVVLQSTIAVDLDRGWGDAKGAITLIPDVFGAGVHGLYFNADGAGNTPSKDLYAIQVDTNTFTASLAWTADGGKSTKSHVIYSAVTGRLYTATWGDDGQQFYSFDPVTGAVVGNNSAEGSGSGYNDFAALDFNGTDILATGFNGNILRYHDNGDGTTTATYYPTSPDYGEFRFYGGLYQNAQGESVVVLPTRSQGIDNAMVIAVNVTAEPDVSCTTFDDAPLYVDNLKITQGPTGVETTVFDTAGFEGYALGDLPGQENPGGIGTATWEDNTGGISGVGMAQIVNTLPGRAGKGMKLDAAGGCGGYQGAFARLASAVSGQVVIVSWDQYRGDLTDNIWISENSDYDGWYTYGWDQNGRLYARGGPGPDPVDPGAAMTANVWQKVEYRFDFNAMTVTVTIDGTQTSTESLDPAHTGLDGWNMEIEGTLKSDLTVPPTNTIFTYDTGMYGSGAAQILTGLQMGPAIGGPQQIYYFAGVGGSLVALRPPASVPGDFDYDGDVDRDDLNLLAACAAGPAVSVDAPCADKDITGDGTIDMVDFAAWQRCYSGQDNPGDPNCYP
ncbi:MAG TPA: PQQ-binding-like beta-propeller repeat protein [Phycisphaerae bacterium]|nr:PQQ-binding-like beta-propeller repeat protein [Phycisphaerae bacterium]